MKLGALGALAALSLLVVMTSPSEGRKISACDLKAELQKRFPRWDPFRIDQVVCYAETLSGLDTTLVTKCPGPEVATLSRFANVIPVKGGGMETHDPLPEEGDDLEEEEQEGGEDGEDRRTLSKHNKRPAGVWCRPGTSYYGIFQLSDRLYCDSGENPTGNRCRTSCSAFTDDDITDDIRCFLQTRQWSYFYGPLHQCHTRTCP